MVRIALSLLLIFFASCGGNGKKPIKIAATPIPHSEILKAIQEELEEDKGIEIEIIEIDDYNTPNRYLETGEIDANFFQHLPFLKEQKEQFGYKLSPLTQVHIEPMGVYSKKFSSICGLTKGARVAIPNDPTNEMRALQLFEKEGLIKLDPKVGLKATIANITYNPKELKFIEVDAPMLPRTLDEVDAAVIPSNFALQADLDPFLDPIAKEEPDSPYANIIVVRAGEENRPEFQELKKALNSEKIRIFILKKYKGGVIPAF